MLWSIFSILLLVYGEYGVAGEQPCFGPRGYGFKSCPSGLGYNTSTPLKDFPVRDAVRCVQACVTHPLCRSVNIYWDSADPPAAHCQLLSQVMHCDSLHKMGKYRFYTKIDEYYPCVTKATEVKAATFLKNNTFSLIFEDTIQKFQLFGETLRAIECPLKVKDYFFEYYGPPKAALRTDLLVVTGPLYYIYDDKVMQYMTPPIDVAYPSYFAPWPDSISNFLGAGIPSDITAAFARGKKFYTLTPDKIYVSEYRSNGTVITGVSPGLHIPDVEWAGVTAAAFNTDTHVLLIFTGNKYFVYHHTKDELLGKGTVCTNL